ncbi:MAG TPA: preprotein translocase subunit YajC [Actinomycetales bacterium]|nr:preprotein translocase subunit YajC [Actinomycetales bacterium]
MEGLLLPILLVLFVVLMFNSQRKRQRAFSQMQSSLQVGQDVVTTAGLHGTIVEIDDDVVVLETSPGQTMTWDRRAIGRVLDTPVLGDDLDGELDDDELDEADVGDGVDPTDDTGVDLDKSRPPTDEK